MQTVPVSFKSAEVLEYGARDDVVEFRLILNDGKDKQVVKRCKLDKPEQAAAEVLTEVKRKLKDAHSTFSLDDEPLAGVVQLQYSQDMDEVEDALKKFLVSVSAAINSGKRSRLAYLDIERKIKGMKAVF